MELYDGRKPWVREKSKAKPMNMVNRKCLMLFTQYSVSIAPRLLGCPVGFGNKMLPFSRPTSMSRSRPKTTHIN